MNDGYKRRKGNGKCVKRESSCMLDVKRFSMKLDRFILSLAIYTSLKPYASI